MYLAYYDESGDDGYSNYYSMYFVLSALYLHHLDWEDTLDQMITFRRQLKSEYGLPISMEFHAGDFLKRKKPFTGFNLSTRDRLDIITSYCGAIASMKVRIVNVCIVKKLIRRPNYNVLDLTLRYSIQIIHNDLQQRNAEHDKFILITDEGRHGVMRKTTRKIRRINYVPSQFQATSLRLDITSLIEDPLPKDSSQSYFIQAADLVAQIIYLYSHYSKGSPNQVANRMRSFVNQTEVTNWMKILRPVLNTLATSRDPYGVVFHPR